MNKVITAFHSTTQGANISKGTRNEVFLDYFMESLGYESVEKITARVSSNDKVSDTDRTYTKDDVVYIVECKSDSIANNNGLADKMSDIANSAKDRFPGKEVKLRFVFFRNSRKSKAPNWSNRAQVEDAGFIISTFSDFARELGADPIEAFQMWEEDKNKHLEGMFFELLLSKFDGIRPEEFEEFMKGVGKTLYPSLYKD